MKEEQYILEEITIQLATWLMEDQDLSMHDALSKVYYSNLYMKIQDLSNGLIAQSDAYLYNLLTEELGLYPVYDDFEPSKVAEEKSEYQKPSLIDGDSVK